MFDIDPIYLSLKHQTSILLNGKLSIYYLLFYDLNINLVLWVSNINLFVRLKHIRLDYYRYTLS